MKNSKFYIFALLIAFAISSCEKDEDTPEPEEKIASITITITESTYGVKSWSSADIYLYTEAGSFLDKKSPSNNGTATFSDLLAGTYGFGICGRVVKYDGGTLTFTKIIYLGSVQIREGQSINKTFAID